MENNKAAKMAKLSSEFMQEIWEILQEYCDENATQVELFACLIASQTAAEAIATRLRNMNVSEDLIQVAIENAKNQVVLLLKENEGTFYMKGEEV